MAHRWSKDEIALEILRLYEAGEELNYGSVQAKHLKLLRAATRYFGSWQSAIEFASLNYDDIRRYRVWSEDKIIERIRKYHREGKDLSWRHVSTGHSTRRWPLPQFGTSGLAIGGRHSTPPA